MSARDPRIKKTVWTVQRCQCVVHPQVRLDWVGFIELSHI